MMLILPHQAESVSCYGLKIAVKGGGENKRRRWSPCLLCLCLREKLLFWGKSSSSSLYNLQFEWMNGKMSCCLSPASPWHLITGKIIETEQEEEEEEESLQDFSNWALERGIKALRTEENRGKKNILWTPRRQSDRVLKWRRWARKTSSISFWKGYLGK